MFRALVYTLLSTTLLIASDYRWPIRASQSLSATFCEFRQGHLHAGVDIKTWGEMEVPCLAIAEGYIERVIVGYNGYGRGIFLRLHDGNVAVYGHMELFLPEIEALVKAEQLKQNKYSIRIKFSPDQFPVKAGQIVGYSGTSGTEHPHLHFEIRDTLHQVINPQLFYTGVKDTKAPVLDELLLFPASHDTRINDSHFPVTIDVAKLEKPISVTGPFQVAVNAHDRANGTFNKYNIFRAETFINDSLVFKRKFDRVTLELTDSIDAIYPGQRGMRGWRFMSMFSDPNRLNLPFAPPDKHGTIDLDAVSTLKVSLSDIQGNTTSKDFLFQPVAKASWSIEQSTDQIAITRAYPDNGYERFQFYSGKNSFIPVAQTLYRLRSTTWIIHSDHAQDGIRALGALGSTIKWVIPPTTQAAPDIRYQWIPRSQGYVLRLNTSEPFIFPLSLQLMGDFDPYGTELIQTGPQSAESDLVSFDLRAQSDSVIYLNGASQVLSHSLAPLTELSPFSSLNVSLPQQGIVLEAKNEGSKPLYIEADTVSAIYDDQTVMGIRVNTLGQDRGQFSGHLKFQHPESDQAYAVFKPGKKDVWRLLHSRDTTTFTSLEINKGGEYFLLQDSQAPTVRAIHARQKLRPGDRLVFEVKDASGYIHYRRPSLSASLDGELFFPDYNPLRSELSFHVPKSMASGSHRFQISLRDASGNTRDFEYQFIVSR